MPEIHRDEVRIHYDTYGDRSAAEHVLFLSGAGSDGAIWKHQVAHLRDRYHLITVDNRGSGRSACPEYPYDADMLAADVEAILTAEGIAATNLVGFSMGGLIAQRFMAKYPDRVRRLVLMNCTLGSGNRDTVLPAKDVINMFLFSSALTQEDCCRNAMDYNFGEDLAEEDPELYAGYFDYTMHNCTGLQYQIPIMVSDRILIDDYSAITAPVLCILSRADKVTPFQNGVAFEKHLPRARIEFLEGYHASMLIRPAEVNRLLEGFLADGQS